MSSSDNSVSIHAPWEGCDKEDDCYHTLKLGFNSRTLGRVRPINACNVVSQISCFNSRTLGRVRLPGTPQLLVGYEVSIHAPWEGCDPSAQPFRWSALSFNSRTLGRVRLDAPITAGDKSLFQFTHPGKGATKQSKISFVRADCFNSRTLGRVRLCVTAML